MKSLSHQPGMSVSRGGIVLIAAGLLVAGLGSPALGQNGADVTLLFTTTLETMELTGGPFPIPLASDPGNVLGDSVDGYGFVDSTVELTLSSERAVNPGPASTGQAFAYPSAGGRGAGAAIGAGEPDEIDPEELHGELFVVDSFFDVFFDITITDVDDRPGRDFAGQPDGASATLEDNQTQISTGHEATFDKTAENFGLVPPPESDPFIGFFTVEIPLGGDINGNEIPDKIKFTFGTISVLDSNITFVVLPDGTVLTEFDSGAFLEGAVVDESTDPPFTIGAQLPNGLPDPNVFFGPTTASSNLLNPIVPEPATLWLLGSAGVICVRNRRRRSRSL